MMTDRDKNVVRVVSEVINGCVCSLPVDIKAVCQAHEVRLIPASSYLLEGIDAQSLFRAWGNPDGVAMRWENEYVINYNDQSPSNRRRFTIAEELMHILLGHIEDPGFRLADQNYPDEVYALYETEARRGAGMLLFPPSVWFRFRDLYDVGQLALLCKVSIACASTAARQYSENEEELRALFTPKVLLCDTESLKPLDKFRPIDVWPEEGGIL